MRTIAVISIVLVGIVLMLPADSAPPPSDSDALQAEDDLHSSLSKLDRKDKRLFVKFSTESCGWCKRLNAFLDEPEIQPVLAKDFDFLEIDQGASQGGTELRNRLASNRRSGGVPWFAILDNGGEVLTTASAPQGNIGYPAEPEGIVHFMAMIRKTATTITEDEFSVIETRLKELGKKYGY